MQVAHDKLPALGCVIILKFRLENWRTQHLTPHRYGLVALGIQGIDVRFLSLCKPHECTCHKPRWSGPVTPDGLLLGTVEGHEEGKTQEAATDVTMHAV